MNTGTVQIGRLFGISVTVHWSVGIIAALLGASLAQSIGWMPAALAVVAFLASIVAHEFAHALTARRFDVDTESIQLWALGGVARLSRESPTAKAEGWIAAAGPLASVLVGAVSMGAWWLLGGPDTNSEFIATLGWLGIINAFLALFNLLPGAPLDGGRILKAIRWAMHGNRFKAAREAGQAGMFLGYAMGGLGLALTLQSQSGIWLLITGVFVAVNARVEIAAASVSERLDGIKVRDLTWFGVAAAGADMDADSMLWQRGRLGQAGGVTVTDASGLTGLVLEDELWAVPAEERPWMMLTQMMVPFDRVARAEPDEDLSSVLSRLDPRRPVLAVWQDGQLVGLVPPKRLKDQLTAAGL